MQIADQGTGLLGTTWVVQAPSRNVGLQTNILHQWNVDPVIDPDDLSLLQLAYRKASILSIPMDQSSTRRTTRFVSCPRVTISR